MIRRIEVQGTWLENAGARQMLRATARALCADHAVDLAIDPRWGARGLVAGLEPTRIVPREMPGRRVAESMLAVLTRVAPRSSLRALGAGGFVERRHLDGLVDASGFALSDQWGARKARQRWDVVRRYAVTGRPVVLLPQAMGPFSDHETAALARNILEAATLVYLRDDASLAHARSLVGNCAHMRRAPDVTILEPGAPPGGAVADVVLVPNARLVDQGGWGQAMYLEILARCGDEASRRGRRVEVMCHTDEAGDRTLADALAERLRCVAVREPDERRAKGRLAVAELVVGSRYHALLGALSQGTPAVALGWSHKYDELFVDFGVAELSSPRDPDPVASVGRVADALDGVDSLKARIGARLPALRADVEEMWCACRVALGVAAPSAKTRSLR